MIKIGPPSVTLLGPRARLSADIDTGASLSTVWFEVDSQYAAFLSDHCSDPFVMLSLPLALYEGTSIQCAAPVTERLHYQLEQYLIPALRPKNSESVTIQAPLFSGPLTSQGAVGTVQFGEEVHSLYPPTHLLVLTPEQKPVSGLETVFMTIHADDLLRNFPVESGLFRTLAGALALQRLFSVFQIPCVEGAQCNSPIPSAVGYHLLLTESANLNWLSFYLLGMDQSDPDKTWNRAPAIRVGSPRMEVRGIKCRLSAPVEINGDQRTLWFEVDDAFGKYFVLDRADAFVVGLLPAAMTLGSDIICEHPVTKRLLYQLNSYLIPTLSSHIERWNPMTIHAAPTEERLACEGAVATGWTAGTDCFYTLMKHLDLPQKSRQLTHLLVASHGAIEGRDCAGTLGKMVDNARAFAEGKNLSVIGINSNVQTFDDEGYGEVGSFRSGTVILALQKLFGTYLHSSDYALSRFTFKKHGDGYYQFLSLGYLESDTTVFYSAGGAVSKLVKTQALAEYPLAYDALHPCVYATRSNCGRCAKCMWTETALHAFGALEKFGTVFDVEDFYANKEHFLTSIVRDKHLTSYEDLLNYMREQNVEQEFIAKTDHILQRIHRAKRNQLLWQAQQARKNAQKKESED